MKKDEMFSVLGEIEDRYLDEALNYAPRRNRTATILRILMPVAAVIALLTVTLSIAIPQMNKKPLPSETGMPQLTLDPSDSPIQNIYNDLAYKEYKDHIEITDYLGKEDNVEIPPTIDGQPVTDVTLNGSSSNTKPTFSTVTVKSKFLSSLTLPEGCNIVLEIGKTVEKIAPGVFRNKSITWIKVAAENKNYTAVDGILYNQEATVLVACPEGYRMQYLRTEGMTVYNEKKTALLPKTVQKISPNAFKGVTALISVEVGENVKEIGATAFADCSTLRSVSINGRVSALPKDVLAGCAELEYFYCALPKEAVNIQLPENTKCFYALSSNVSAEQVEMVVNRFLEAEEAVSLFTRFHMIDCDPGTVKDSYFLVTDKRADTAAKLRTLLAGYLEKKLINQIYILDNPEKESYFKEMDGELYVGLKRVPIEYDAGRDDRGYAVNVDADGTIHLTVRCKVPQIDVAIYSEMRYTLKENDQGVLLFTDSFVIPMETLYRHYLMEKKDNS